MKLSERAWDYCLLCDDDSIGVGGAMSTCFS